VALMRPSSCCISIGKWVVHRPNCLWLDSFITLSNNIRESGGRLL
jgi:hypothetical protein